MEERVKKRKKDRWIRRERERYSDIERGREGERRREKVKEK